MAEERVIKVTSSDNQVFEMEDAVAFQSQFIKDALDLAGVDAIISLDEIEGSIFAKVYQYCKFHADARKTKHLSRHDVEKWEKDFVDVDQDTITLLSRAAHYLGIKNNLDLICKSKPLHEKIADGVFSPTPLFYGIPSYQASADGGCQMLFPPVPSYQYIADGRYQMLLFPAPFNEAIRD